MVLVSKTEIAAAKAENVKVENGKIVITVPVDSQSGFMILQSGDAKVGN